MSRQPSNQESRLQEALSRLYGQGEFKIKLGLAPMLDALAVCAHPEHGFPSVVVAGTNGKGSVCAMLAAFAQHAGAKVGLYTSPHLIHFAERIRVQGRPLPEDALLDLMEPVLNDFGQSSPLPERTAEVRHTLTFFELATLIAVLAFARQRCDLAIMEVGMGGRLDATNALSPCLSVITSIGLDHQAYLGETINEIAIEKAGIMRPSVPAVLGTGVALSTLKAHAKTLGTPTLCLGEDFGVDHDHGRWLYWGPYGRTDITSHPWARLAHGRDNIATALTAGALLSQSIKCLNNQNITQIFEGIRHARWPGRFQPLSASALERLRVLTQTQTLPTILLDAAHNPPSIQALTRALADTFPQKPWVLLIGAMADKAIEDMFQSLRGCPTLCQVVVTPIQSPRAATPQQLCLRGGLPADAAAASLDDALRCGVRAAGPDGLLVIAGSIYLLGEVLQRLGEPWQGLVTYATPEP